MSLKESKKYLDMFLKENGRNCQTDRELLAFIAEVDNRAVNEELLEMHIDWCADC